MNAPRIGDRHATTVRRASNAIAYEYRTPRGLAWLQWIVVLDKFGNVELADLTDHQEWLTLQNL